MAEESVNTVLHSLTEAMLRDSAVIGCVVTSVNLGVGAVLVSIDNKNDMVELKPCSIY